MLITLKILRPVRFKNVSLVVLMVKVCLVFGQPKVLVIDPGHGGKDSGAIGINGIKEKDVVLDIALEILRLNEKSETPVDIYLTRYSDTLISLHCNHSYNSKARGIEIYVGKNESRNSKESVWFAYQLQNQIKKQLGFESRGVKFANFQVLREAADYFPSILVELGFLSNSNEIQHLTEKENIVAITLTIFETTTKLLEL